MVAAASFCYVVEQGGEIEDVRLGEGAHEGGGGGQLVAVFFLGKAAHVPQRHQDVVVHGIGVVQVVLQQAGDFAPFGEIAFQYAV